MGSRRCEQKGCGGGRPEAGPAGLGVEGQHEWNHCAGEQARRERKEEQREKKAEPARLRRALGRR
jgi:hypothetical protein